VACLLEIDGPYEENTIAAQAGTAAPTPASGPQAVTPRPQVQAAAGQQPPTGVQRPGAKCAGGGEGSRCCAALEWRGERCRRPSDALTVSVTGF
jgi:hypothetical protein